MLRNSAAIKIDARRDKSLNLRKALPRLVNNLGDELFTIARSHALSDTLAVFLAYLALTWLRITLKRRGMNHILLMKLEAGFIAGQSELRLLIPSKTPAEMAAGIKSFSHVGIIITIGLAANCALSLKPPATEKGIKVPIPISILVSLSDAPLTLSPDNILFTRRPLIRIEYATVKAVPKNPMNIAAQQKSLISRASKIRSFE